MSISDTHSENPRDLEQHADEKRSEINRTLSQIEDHFSPSQMIDQAMGMFRGNGGEMANNLGRTVRDNPVPVILTGVGLAWMALSQNSSRSRMHDRGYDDYPDYRASEFDRYSDTDYRQRDPRYLQGRSSYRQGGTPYGADTDSYRPGQNTTGRPATHTDSGMQSASVDATRSQDDDQSLIDKAKEAGNDALDTLADVRDEAGYRYREEAERARHAAQDWRNRAGDHMQDFRGSMRSTADDASRFMREQPLVVGAAGIALGAFIGALLPPTRVEDRLAGQQSDAITDDVEQLADEKLKQGASAAREQLQNTAENVRESASDALSKADKKLDSKTDEPASTV
ncbi:hypothetical protein ACUNV4_19885 [Granulosicoccus sp. 3-233]|uniref:hypothetical protein n=1 Tax=Granulosicoccus sp. 3-233 TaxID=3417969 RepID=UPI003D3556C2